MNNILEVKKLHKSYYKKEGLLKKTREYPVLKDIDLNIRQGEIVGLLGESGCGKSTLSKSIVNLSQVNSGEILFQGENIANMREDDFHKYRKDIQYISQNPFTSFNNKMKIEDILMEGMDEYNIGSRQERRDKILYLLEECKLDKASLFKYPYEFSGGQLQRLAIARALSLEPRLVLADEIVSALDISVQAQILDLLLKLQRDQDLSLLFISHDLAVVRKISDYIYIMKEGEIVDQGDRDYIFQASEHPYTQKLIDAIPVFPY